MKPNYIILLFTTLMIFSGCKKFLDVKPKGVVIPERIAEYEGILNSNTIITSFDINLLYCTDDYFNVYDAADASPQANIYYWKPNIDLDQRSNPIIWGQLYRVVYNANVIINGVKLAKDGTELKKEQVLAEALVNRSYAYLDLLTVFAKSYDPQTAATDPGLPMPTSTNVTDVVPSRSSVKVTIDVILNDALKAADVLPETNLNRTRVTKYVAYGLISRIYLYIGDYVNAKKYAELALVSPHGSLDYNNYKDNYALPDAQLNPEVLWVRLATNPAGYGAAYSTDLLSHVDAQKDLRYELFVIKDSKTRRHPTGRVNMGITFPEMELVRAEVLARQNDYEGAMQIVNNLRKNRTKKDLYTDQVAGSGAEALEFVLSQRRIETAFGGIRWFDMKRLDQDGKMPVVKRIDRTTQAELSVLEPKSPKYTFEIPLRVLNFNPGMERNYK